jgi:hypothetical protein
LSVWVGAALPLVEDALEPALVSTPLFDAFSLVEFCVGAARVVLLADDEPERFVGMFDWFSFVEFSVAEARGAPPSLVWAWATGATAKATTNAPAAADFSNIIILLR